MYKTEEDDFLIYSVRNPLSPSKEVLDKIEPSIISPLTYSKEDIGQILVSVLILKSDKRRSTILPN